MFIFSNSHYLSIILWPFSHSVCSQQPAYQWEISLSNKAKTNGLDTILSQPQFPFTYFHNR